MLFFAAEILDELGALEQVGVVCIIVFQFAFELGEGYILASSPQAYEAYRTGYGGYARPPELTAEGGLPDFPLSR